MKGFDKNNKKTRIAFWLKKWWQPLFLFTIFTLSVIIIVATPIIEKSILEDNNMTSQNGYSRKIVAPFVDMTGWVDPSSAYSINGAPNLQKFAEDTDTKTYCLGFINPVSSAPLESSGSINWAWGGYAGLSKNSTNSQYLGIVQSMQNLENIGGKYIISVGGQAGNAPWKVTQSVDKLEEFYKDIVDTYSIDRLDLDIEEDNQDYEQNVANAKAIKRLQNYKNVEIVLTIPIMPDGWQNKQINIIRAYLEQGVNIVMINSMCMCYGTGVNSDEDYGDASLRAIENSVVQMRTLYSNHGIELTDAQAYAKTGCTVSIGYESSLYPTFTTSMMQKVTNHAKEHGYAMLSFWSMGRDSKIENNAGISSKYAYLNIVKQYLE